MKNKYTALYITIIIGFITLLYFRYQKNNLTCTLAQNIYNILDEYRIPYDLDQCALNTSPSLIPLPVTGKKECIVKLQEYIRATAPIRFLLVSFPYKSANREKKVLGHLPDMAERKSLEYLHSILAKIKTIYSPGATIDVFCDGAFFSEFLGIPDKHVLAYENTLKILAQDLDGIILHTTKDLIQDFLPLESDRNIQALRNLIDQYPPNDQAFREKIGSPSQTSLALFTLEFDHELGRRLLTLSSLETIVMRLLAREERMRNFIAHIFSTQGIYGPRFRLTVHFSNMLAKKFGIRMSPTSFINPYHGTLVEEIDGTWLIQFKKDIDLQKYRLTEQKINGICCPYFKARRN